MTPHGVAIQSACYCPVFGFQLNGMKSSGSDFKAVLKMAC